MGCVFLDSCNLPTLQAPPWVASTHLLLTFSIERTETTFSDNCLKCYLLFISQLWEIGQPVLIPNQISRRLENLFHLCGSVVRFASAGSSFFSLQIWTGLGQVLDYSLKVQYSISKFQKCNGVCLINKIILDSVILSSAGGSHVWGQRTDTEPCLCSSQWACNIIGLYNPPLKTLRL